MCERLYHGADAIAHMSFESAITIILTALAVMLAVVTIGIAGLAIWGYFGIRDSVKEMATKKVDDGVIGDSSSHTRSFLQTLMHSTEIVVCEMQSDSVPRGKLTYSLAASSG